MSTNIAATAKIFPGVSFGANVVVEDFCLIGCPPAGVAAGELETVIGDNALIRSHTIIYAGTTIGDNFQTGNKANIRESNVIGSDVSIGTLSVVEFKTNIGNGVRIHSQVFIPEYSVLAENAWLGPNVVLTNAKYPCSPGVKENLAGPTIEKNAKIGANSTILPGLRLGEGSLVGAGSVVTKNIPAFAVAVGNPAEVVKEIKDLPYE